MRKFDFKKSVETASRNIRINSNCPVHGSATPKVTFRDSSISVSTNCTCQQQKDDIKKEVTKAVKEQLAKDMVKYLKDAFK